MTFSLFLFFLIFAFLFPSWSHAESKAIIAEGKYNMGDGETPTVAENGALVNAKRDAVEQAGTYIESYSKVNNFQLTADEVQAASAAILEVTILDKKRDISGDGGITFWVKIRANVNADNLPGVLNELKEKGDAHEAREIKEDYLRLEKELNELKALIKAAGSENEKKQIQAKFADQEKRFQAKTWCEEGKKKFLNKEYDKGIEAFTSAIALDPTSEQAYRGRGLIFFNQKQYERALEDVQKTIDLAPANAVNWNNRGYVYYTMKQMDKALEDLSKSIQLKADYAKAYTNRGRVYLDKKDFDSAIKDYSKAVELDPRNMVTYNNRGTAFLMKGDIDPAIQDYNKAIELNSKYAMAYYNRGIAYQRKKNLAQATEDYRAAARLGYERAQEWLTKRNLSW